MIVVADTTPISELAKVGYLNLLYELFERVIIPQEVYSELTTGNHPAVEIVSTLSWLEVVQIRNPKQVKVLQSTSNLDLGEVAAMILAEELKADQLLIDERAARRVAKTRQLPIIGTVGILILAKQRGLIDRVQPILDGMIKNGTRIGERLYMQALILSQENQ
jgi:predicted nucleic acid-binding protein